MSFLYAAKGNYESSFEYCEKSLFMRERMSDDVCVAARLPIWATYINQPAIMKMH